MILSINLYFSILFCFYCFTYEPTAIVNNECYNIQVKYWWLKCDPYHVSNKHKIIYNINSAIPMIFSSYNFKCFSSKLLIITFLPKLYPWSLHVIIFPSLSESFPLSREILAHLINELPKSETSIVYGPAKPNCTSNYIILKHI